MVRCMFSWHLQLFGMTNLLCCCHICAAFELCTFIWTQLKMLSSVGCNYFNTFLISNSRPYYVMPSSQAKK